MVRKSVGATLRAGSSPALGIKAKALMNRNSSRLFAIFLNMALFLRFSTFRFDFATRIFVAVQSTQQGTDFIVAFSFENDRRTGGRMFARSGTVKNQMLVFGQFVEFALGNALISDVDRAFGVHRFVAAGIAHIY